MDIELIEQPTPFYIRAFSDIPWVDARFFKAVGGFSTAPYASRDGSLGLNCAWGGNDRPEVKKKNRELVARSFGVPVEKILTTLEIIKTKAVIVTNPWTLETRPPEDGVVTRSLQNYVVGVLGRDCAPILFADIKKPIIGAAHVGHVGAFAGIIEEMVRNMRELGSRTSDLCAAIGPCVGVEDTYEVKEDFVVIRTGADPESRSFFREVGNSMTVFRFEDYLAHRLQRAGISRIERTGIDTISDLECYSGRGKSLPSSLMFSGIMLKSTLTAGN